MTATDHIPPIPPESIIDDEALDFSDANFVSPDEISAVLSRQDADEAVALVDEAVAAVEAVEVASDELAGAEVVAISAVAATAGEPPGADPPIRTIEALDAALAADLAAAMEEQGPVLGVCEPIEVAPVPPLAEPASASASASREAPAHSVTPAPATSFSHQPTTTLRGRHASAMKSAALVALVPLSLPIRIVPESMRKYVDWLALSLVFWSPIVWLIAVFLSD